MSEFSSSSDAAEGERMDVMSRDRTQLPWVEKYRPSTLQDLIAHEDIISILNKLIDSNKLPHLLFHGPPGNCIWHKISLASS